MGDVEVRRATIDDADDVARLLHAFNLEFNSPTPGEEFLARRLGELLASEAITVLVAGDEPIGVAVLRLRPALWSDGLDAYLEELYVVPEERGKGAGRALLEATITAARASGAVRIELGTDETDTAARALYESAGFTNFDLDQSEEGVQMLFYERDLRPCESQGG